MPPIHRRAFALQSMLLGASAAQAASWNQWRGPSRSGFVADTSPWPERLQGNLTQLYAVKLQPSYSGPVVAGGRVFVTETVDRKREAVHCLDANTGQRIWRKDWEGAMSVPFFARANGSWIRATPCIASGRILVGGMRDVLVCLDTATGEELWRNDFVASQKKPLPTFGFVSSPLIHEEHAFVQAGGALLKVSMQDGRVVWRSLDDGGGMLGSAFSSPLLADLAGRQQLVVQTRSHLAGVDAGDGAELWRQEVPAFRGMNIVTPTVADDAVFTSSYGGGSFCYDVSSTGQGFAVRERWKNRVQGYMNSPLVLDGHAYLHLKNQRFSCMDLADGKQKWSSRPFGKYWSTIAQGDRILALDERGVLRLVRANPQSFELIDEQTVANDAWAHVAVVDDLIFVRDLEQLLVFRWQQGKTAAS